MAQTAHLVSFGPVLVISNFPAPVLCILQLSVAKTLIIVYKKTKEISKNSPMAQTTHLASFGPVLFISFLPVVYLVDYNYM